MEILKIKKNLQLNRLTLVLINVLKSISAHQNKNKSPLQKLYLITDFYKNYYDFSKKIGGCPILNTGVNSKNQNNKLHHEVMLIIDKTQSNIAKLIDQGKELGYINKNINSINFARRLYSHIQGAVFMSYAMNDKNYLYEAVEEMNLIIKKELEKA